MEDEDRILTTQEKLFNELTYKEIDIKLLKGEIEKLENIIKEFNNADYEEKENNKLHKELFERNKALNNIHDIIIGINMCDCSDNENEG